MAKRNLTWLEPKWLRIELSPNVCKVRTPLANVTHILFHVTVLLLWMVISYINKVRQMQKYKNLNKHRMHKNDYYYIFVTKLWKAIYTWANYFEYVMFYYPNNVTRSWDTFGIHLGPIWGTLVIFGNLYVNLNTFGTHLEFIWVHKLCLLTYGPIK